MFLFNISKDFELISISNMENKLGNIILNKLDPYGFISHRIFENKDCFSPKNLNRSLNQTIIISSDKREFHPKLKNNIIFIDKWNGKNSNDLFQLIHFFINMSTMGIPNFQKTINSYKNKNFFNEFEKRQKINYNQRNIFNFWNFDKQRKEIAQHKITEFESLKIKYPIPKINNYFNSFARITKMLIFD